MSKTDKQKVGGWGERVAARFLLSAGYSIVMQNYEVCINGKKAGELDIIAWHDKVHHGKTLCFIEVKTREKNDGSAERATGPSKKQRLLTAARHYCLEKGIDIGRTPIQFEQISVYARRGELPEIRHYVIPVD